MMRSMFAAISGLKAHQMMLDVTANDIANVNTLGYKAERVTFKDSLSQLQRTASAPGVSNGGSNAAQIGLGVQLSSIDNLTAPGAIQPTGNVTDVAVQGEGWFRVATGAPPMPAPPGVYAPPTGPVQPDFTRAGNFTRNSEGYLVTQDGYYVVGRDALGNDCYLNIPSDATNVAIAQDGSVSFDPPGGGPRVIAGYLSLAKFANEAGLQRVSGNRWSESASSGAEQVDTPGNTGHGLIISGAVEMSNVDLATEFTNMITAQRGFQANSRIISTSDEMLQELVNMKR
ncbi:MAG: flagellar hook-basal body complex protein [Solirubrobacteraceae bacterium]|nr:flagellar hook-basal body complex protein [Solirubrobacteraceae bacterium]